jgi:signal-induced proliferation-associated 1 like protein 3
VVPVPKPEPVVPVPVVPVPVVPVPVVPVPVVPVLVVPVPELLPPLAPPLPEPPLWAKTEGGKDTEAKLMAKTVAKTALDKSKGFIVMVPFTF